MLSRVRETVAALRLTAGNAGIRRAEIAWCAAISAEWMHFVGLGVYAYANGGVTAVGVAGLVRLLPAAIVAPFAATLGDRYRRERFLLGLSLLGAGALLVSAAGAAADERNVVFAAAAVVGVCVTLFRPALVALLPSLARTARELIAANGATSTIESFGTLAGPLVAGVVVALVDVEVVFVVAAAAFALAAMMVAGVTSTGAARSPAEAGTEGVSIWAGFRALRDSSRTRLLVGLIASQTFVRGCLNVVLVVVAFQVLDGGASAVGYLTAAIGAGGLVGALGAVSLRGERLAPPFAWALVCWGLPIVLIAPLPYVVPVVLLLAAVGAANSVVDVAGFTLLQRTVPDALLASALGITWAMAMGGVALGSFVAPAVIDQVGLRGSCVLFGAILPVLVILVRRPLYDLDREPGPASNLGAVEAVQVFAPLSLVAKERIAASLEPADVTAGDVVFREGDPGDRFYLVGAGDLVIRVGDRAVPAGPGDFFGEIALLHDVPRTGTVTATTDATLYALGREDFLAIMAGHPLAESEARSIAAGRLAND